VTDNRSKLSVTILICDDDEDDRFLTAQALGDARVANDLRFVEDGEQLLDYLYQRGAFAGEMGKAPRPGLILLDLHMPRMDGREALMVIKGDPTLRDIPIVVLSTSRFEDEIARTYVFGANSFICKPVTFSKLVDAMHTLGQYWVKIVELPPQPAAGPARAVADSRVHSTCVRLRDATFSSS